MDYKKYAAVDRTALLEVLISRGMYQQAMSIVSQFGYEGIRIESQLKPVSYTHLRCAGYGYLCEYCKGRF